MYGSERTTPALQGLLDLLAEYIATWQPWTDSTRWLFHGEQSPVASELGRLQMAKDRNRSRFAVVIFPNPLG